MRMTLPEPDVRARIVGAFRSFYRTGRRSWLRLGLSEWSAFYTVPAPKIVLRKRMRRYQDGTWLRGLTHENNVVELWLPGSWQAQTEGGGWTEAEYVRTVLHELAHCLYFVNAERRADLYASRFVRGV